MSESTTDIRIMPLASSRDVLTDLLRDGAPRLLAQAVEAKVAARIDDQALKEVAAVTGPVAVRVGGADPWGADHP